MTGHEDSTPTENGGQEIFWTKIISIDGDAAIEIPPAILAQLGLEEGDTLEFEVVGGQARALIGRKVPSPRD